jgi:hypothetical protein
MQPRLYDLGAMEPKGPHSVVAKSLAIAGGGDLVEGRNDVTYAYSVDQRRGERSVASTQQIENELRHSVDTAEVALFQGAGHMNDGVTSDQFLRRTKITLGLCMKGLTNQINVVRHDCSSQRDLSLATVTAKISLYDGLGHGGSALGALVLATVVASVRPPGLFSALHSYPFPIGLALVVLSRAERNGALLALALSYLAVVLVTATVGSVRATGAGLRGAASFPGSQRGSRPGERLPPAGERIRTGAWRSPQPTD